MRTAAERASLLDHAQCAAIAETLQFLVDEYRDKAAAALLASWRAHV